MRHLLLAIAICVATLAPAAHEPLQRARADLATAHVSRMLTLADSLQAAGQDSPELRRLEGDALWVAGSPRALDIADTLRAAGDDLGADLLLLKIDLLLGRPLVRDRLDELRRQHPDHPELRLVQWLLDLDAGDWDAAAESAEAVARHAACRFVPPAALFMAATDRDSFAVIRALSVVDRIGCPLYRKLRRKLQDGAIWSGPCRVDGTCELPYADCGTEIGLQMTAVNGRRLTLAIDTGTGTGLITLHELEPGEALPGPEIMRLEDGIHYRYMDEPVDVVCKLVDFREPPLSRRPVEYFDGDFDMADGCVSPFAFPGAALTVDPRAQKVWLRDRADLEAYLRGVDPRRTAVVPYVRRGGWIFVPARVNGHEVLLMVESGSRDVNLNALAARRLGIPTRDGTLEWRGKPYPVQRADLTVEIGGLTYRCTDALVDDYTLGNNWTGQASAGDLGPDFLRHYRFTIDPFGERLVLEELGD